MRASRIGGAVFEAEAKGQFAEELAELHDGSINLFVTMPVAGAEPLRGTVVAVREVLKDSLARIGSIALQLVAPHWDSQLHRELSDAVA